MSTEDGYIMDDLGVQGDGEPAVTEEPPVPTEAAPEAAPEAEQPQASEEGEEKPHKKPGSVRLKERLAREAQEKEYWRNLALEAQQKGSQPAPAKAADPAAPRPEQFESHEEWVEAVADYRAEKKLAEREAKAQADAMRNAWEQKAADVRAEAPDFDEVLEDAPAPSPAVANALHKSQNGARLAYHLAKNPDVYDRINVMQPFEAAMELGRIEARLEAGRKAPEATKAPAPVSKAPKPLAPVSSPAAVKPGDDGRLVLY